jgi:DNA-binding SARP family transcriptional activator/TolB-like protein
MIEFRTLGGLDLKDSGESRSISAQPKRLALLTYLALADSSGFRRRDSILALLWPDLDEAHARGALRQGLHFLRRSLGEDALVSRGEEEVGVNNSAFWCDAVAFDALQRAREHALALELYRGDFLEGFFVSDVAPEFEQWVEGHRSVFRQAASSSAWAVAETKRREGNIDSAVVLARRAVVLAPTDEAASARLIEFLDSLGDRAGALLVHDELIARLRSEYGAQPSPETQAVIERVRSRTVLSPLTGHRPAQPVLEEEHNRPDPGMLAEQTRGPPGGKSTQLPPEPDASTRAGRSPARYFGTALLVAVAGIIIVIAARVPTPENRILSVAVMPLEDLGRDSSRAYVADGITDQLITDLAQAGALQVINRRTMMTYRNSRETPAQVARELHTDAVVSGTIQTFGDTVHMTAQLVLAGQDKAIWAQTFEATRGDLLRMQREAARALSTRMRGAAAQNGVASVPGMNPEALDLYIRGRYYWNKRGPGLLTSIQFFTDALDIDPRFALAWSGMADAYVQLGYGSVLAPSDAFLKAREAANKALALDSTMAEPHATLAFVKMYYDWDWKGAEKEFNQALKLNPSYATAHEWYGLFLAAMGRFDEARAHEHRAQELDPLSTAIGGTAGWVLYYSGRKEEAARALDISLRQDSTFALGHFYRGRVYEAMGNPSGALAQYESTGPLRTWVPTIAAEGHLYGTLHRTHEANAVLYRLDSLSRHQYVTAYGVALVYRGLGQRDSTFAWLERGLQERTHWMVWLNRDPRWEPIRGDPRFVRLIRLMKLPD